MKRGGSRAARFQELTRSLRTRRKTRACNSKKPGKRTKRRKNGHRGHRSGNIGGTAARLFFGADHRVAVSNSRGPETLRGFVEELRPNARAATV